jgi:hypothetical protein
MDKATIQEIAAEVVRHLPNYAWALLLVQVLLTLLAAAAGASFGEYLKTRGKNLATKADFESLQNQLRANTELVETIKAEVGQRDWTARERTSLRRIQLEALLEKMNDCDNYIDQHRNRFMDSKGTDPDQRDYLNELNAMGSLYFPELENEVRRFYVSGKEQITLGLDLAQKLDSAGNDMAARKSAYDTFRRKWRERYKEHSAARSALTAAARRLLVSIMDVEEGSRDNRSEAPTETH